MAYQVGQYSIGALAYTMRDPVTGKDVHVSGKVWIRNAEGEGMEADPSRIPEGVTEEWMDRFWQEHF
jgi:hypothetical protein